MQLVFKRLAIAIPISCTGLFTREACRFLVHMSLQNTDELILEYRSCWQKIKLGTLVAATHATKASEAMIARSLQTADIVFFPGTRADLLQKVPGFTLSPGDCKIVLFQKRHVCIQELVINWQKFSRIWLADFDREDFQLPIHDADLVTFAEHALTKNPRKAALDKGSSSSSSGNAGEGSSKPVGGGSSPSSGNVAHDCIDLTGESDVQEQHGSDPFASGAMRGVGKAPADPPVSVKKRPRYGQDAPVEKKVVNLCHCCVRAASTVAFLHEGKSGELDYSHTCLCGDCSVQYKRTGPNGEYSCKKCGELSKRMIVSA